MNRFTVKALCATAAMLASLGAAAQGYPNKPIRIVVPFPAGGMSDIVTRATGDELAKLLGQPFVIENKPGAGSTLGAEFVAKSPPDGYTLLLATTSTLSVAPHLYKTSMRYDAERDLVPISLLARSPNLLLVAPDLPAKNVQELIALAKAKPGTLSFASAGIGAITHLQGEQFKLVTGTDIVHVPYKGSSLAVPDINTGRVHMMIDVVGVHYTQVQAGKMRALAAMTDKRLAVLPNVPSIAELGFPALAADTWFGLVAPATTPPEVIAKLQTAIAKAFDNAALRDKFTALGVELVGSTPAEMTKVVKADSDRWSRVIREGKVSVQ
ncbi:MAG: tripartite tricarboxylate transporter substrate binding protein [Burkholderiaceae bacterium]